ncbi:MAG: hypothetical protein EKK37_17455 [Sphingobacteriales bacterium]|nr:MAG: hypothetical protein EKK37_17455 [Sphingobacteriales bacterium]
MTPKTNELQNYLRSSEHLNKKAASDGNLKHFLLPFFCFRLYVRYKNKKKPVHLYGNEHQCTYYQLQTGRVPHIELSQTKGYTDLIRYVEEKIKGKYLTAIIYRRTGDHSDFNIECRRYNEAGQLEKCQDPVIDPEVDKRILYYYFKNGELQLQYINPNNEDFKINL